MIQRRKLARPLATCQIWAIPTCVYSAMKICGAKFNSIEYIWWILIPVIASLWFFTNFKIVSKSK